MKFKTNALWPPATLGAVMLVLGMPILGMFAFGKEDTPFEQWQKAYTWPNDSLSRAEAGTMEIFRDVSDLWFATRDYRTPGLFSTICLYHGFLYLTSQAARSIFDTDEKADKIRLVLFMRRSSEATPETVAKIRINKSTFFSSAFQVLSQMAAQDGTRFASVCREKFDGVWINDSIAKE